MPARNIRRAFKADEGDYWVSVDYKAQELRIPSNLSGEPVWSNAFIHGQDIHTKTAISIWGEENYNKDKRKMAKTANFGILYGMNEYTFAERYGMTLAEGKEFVMSFKRALPILFTWVDRHVKKAKKVGTVYTYFGGPRRVKFYLNHADYKKRGFGQRTAVNTVIQGAAACCLKMCMLRLWKNLFTNPEYKGKAAFRSTIHDEVNFSVCKNDFLKTATKIKECMDLKIKGWPVELETDMSIGYSWGDILPWRFLPDGSMEPAYDILSPEVHQKAIDKWNAKNK